VESVVTLFLDRGTEDYLNCKGRVDIIHFTLGKALGGGAGNKFKVNILSDHLGAVTIIDY